MHTSRGSSLVSAAWVLVACSPSDGALSEDASSSGGDGGACAADACASPAASSGDPCAGITCSGHGVCAAGACTCATGYADPDCASCASGYTLQQGLCVAVDAGTLLMFDDFEYDVARDSTTKSDEFAANGPWNNAKSMPTAGARGYVYTASAIPGYAGTFPGISSARALCIEALPDTQQGQTDFFLQYGAGTDPIGHIPANHWFQFWLYAAHSGTQLGKYSHGKLIYPNRADFYPATTDNGGFVYVMTFDKGSGGPLDVETCPGGTSVGCPSFFTRTIWDPVNALDSMVPYAGNTFSANLANDVHAADNQWTLFKIHIDLSGTDPRATAGQAVYEMWLRRAGSAAWVKVVEYFGGVTEVNGTAVALTPAYNDGFRMFRMPTTFGATSATPGDWFDSWTYIDDFALASAEGALPVYP
jgi:hypothetical protein